MSQPTQPTSPQATPPKATWTQAYIGLGSNLDNPAAQIARALTALNQIPATQLELQSRLYRNRAIGPGEQPDYLNAVALLRTALEPHQLLDELQAIEQQQGRVRHQRWAARTLDLDLLLYGTQVISSERLTVPHPLLTQRDFVLYPLADINPQLELPNGQSLASLLAQHPADGLEALPN